MMVFSVWALCMCVTVLMPCASILTRLSSSRSPTAHLPPLSIIHSIPPSSLSHPASYLPFPFLFLTHGLFSCVPISPPPPLEWGMSYTFIPVHTHTLSETPLMILELHKKDQLSRDLDRESGLTLASSPEFSYAPNQCAVNQTACKC